MMRVSVLIVLALLVPFCPTSAQDAPVGMNQELMSTVEEFLATVQEIDGTPVPNSFKEIIRSDVAKYLSERERFATEEQKEVILGYVPHFIEHRIGAAPPAPDWDESEPVKLWFIPEKARSIARSLVVNVDRALQREHPLPVGSERDKIFSQLEELINEARIVFDRHFSHLDEAERERVFDRYVTPLHRLAYSPFSSVAKRLLTAEEVNGIRAELQRIAETGGGRRIMHQRRRVERLKALYEDRPHPEHPERSIIMPMMFALDVREALSLFYGNDPEPVDPILRSLVKAEGRAYHDAINSRAQKAISDSEEENK